eukprot:s2934_g1.t1
MKGTVKVRAISWKERVASGHVPFRKDCLICQQASSKDQHHRRCKDPPRAGVLSLDMTGPFHVAPDLHRKTAKYMLIGAFTWLAPGQSPDDFEEVEIPEVPEGAPEIEDFAGDEPEIEDADGVWGELQAERDRRAQQKKDEAPEEKSEGNQKGEVESEEEIQKIPKVTVTRLCTPLPSKSQHDVLRAIIDMYLRLRSDGFVVTQVHILIVVANFSPMPWIDGVLQEPFFTHLPQVTSRKAMGGSKHRFSGSSPRFEGFFMPPALLFPCCLWRHETPMSVSVSSRMVMHQLTTPPKDDDWIGLEDELAPTEVRRRIRGKVSLNHLSFEESLQEGEAEGEMNPEDEKEKEILKARKLIEEEMQHAVEEEPVGAFFTLDALASLKEMTVNATTEEVLQTRIVAQSEVRKHLPDWIAPIKSELKALFETKGALRPIDPQRVRQLLADGKAEILPSKMVWTVKPCPNDKRGKRKARLVACGNFQAGEPDQDALFAGGATAVALRASLSLASQFGWHGSVTGVKTAFLNAPMKLGGNPHGDQPTEFKVAIIKPPLVMPALKNTGKWSWLCTYRYGYKESPRLWSDFRDEQLTAMKIPMDDCSAELVAPGAATCSSEFTTTTKATAGTGASPGCAGAANEPSESIATTMTTAGQVKVPRNFKDEEIVSSSSTTSSLILDQMVTEPNMWRILKYQPGPFGSTQAAQLVGLLLVYFDDLLVLGIISDIIIKPTIKAIQAKWETSIPEDIDSSSGVRFLGAELFNDGIKWWMTQRNYIQDLLARNLGGNSSSWPTRKIPMASEPETREDPPGRDPLNVKEAQRIVGELVWVSTRTRPDLSYCVNKLASLIARDPLQVIELAKNLWYYLVGSIDHGLQFRNEADEKRLNIYTDASFGELCTGCHLVMWGSSMLLWKSGKQSVVTASTAEAELVEILEGALAGDAVRVVMEEALDEKCRAVSFTDNMASISIVTGDRSQGDWLPRHMAGNELPADLGTKVLSSEKFKFHKVMMGMYLGEDGKDGKKKCDGSGMKGEVSPKAEKTKQALKAIILFAQLAMAKSESDDLLQVWQPNFPLQHFSDPTSGPPFYYIVIMIFVFGLLTGAVVMWMMVYPFFHRVTLVQSQSNVVPRPTFLMEYLPQHQRRRTQSEAPLLRTTSSPMTTNAADGRAAGAADPSNAASSSAADSASAAEASSTAGAAGASSSASAAGASSSASADGASPTVGAAGALPSAAATEREIQNQSAGRRRRGARARILPLYISPAGQRFHCDAECYGLRSARNAHEVQRCSNCGPQQTRPVETLYGLGPGGALHCSIQHVQNISHGGEVKKYEPCAICMFTE